MVPQSLQVTCCKIPMTGKKVTFHNPVLPTMLCGADDFVAMAEFGRKKRKWLARYLDLSAAIPSHDYFHAILMARTAVTAHAQ